MTRPNVRFWWVHALTEPRDFAFVAPRRLACLLLGQHSCVCDGRADHDRPELRRRMHAQRVDRRRRHARLSRIWRMTP